MVCNMSIKSFGGNRVEQVVAQPVSFNDAVIKWVFDMISGGNLLEVRKKGLKFGNDIGESGIDSSSVDVA